MIETKDDKELEIVLQQRNRLVLLDFWSPRCEFCRELAPLVDIIDRELKGEIDVIKVLAEDHPYTVAKLSVTCLPSQYLMLNEVPLERFVGLDRKYFKSKILKKIKTFL